LKNKQTGALFVEIDKLGSSSYIKKELSKLSGRSSMPQVFIKGEYYGGLVELKEGI